MSYSLRIIYKFYVQIFENDTSSRGSNITEDRVRKTGLKKEQDDVNGALDIVSRK